MTGTERVGELDLDEILRLAASKPTGGLLVSETIPALVAELKRLRGAGQTYKRLRDETDNRLADVRAKLGEANRVELELRESWHRLAERADAAEAKLAAVRALHEPYPAIRELLGNVRHQSCSNCARWWPCPTIRALDGEAVTEHE